MVRILALALTSLVFLIAITLIMMTSNYLNQDHAEFSPEGKKPDFTSFTNAADKKNAFFGYLSPIIKKANKRILNKRTRLEKIALNWQQEESLSKSDSKFLNQLANDYGLGDGDESSSLNIEEKISLLLLRVDKVPISLALAQAAKESGWGTSRFARNANNYFGQWCYQKGCGLVPRQRPEGATHEVRKFKTVKNSVDAYLKNLNTNNAYKKLRKIRAELRAQNQISGIELANGLNRYSQRGKKYVEEIQSMIRFNKLDQLDTPIDQQ